jgi:hypothetical protein
MLAIILSNQDLACLSTSHKHHKLPSKLLSGRKPDDHLMTLVQTDVSHIQQSGLREGSRLIRALIALPIVLTHSGYTAAEHKRVWTVSPCR